MTSDFIPTLLSIAGTDPTHAAGICADAQTFRDFGWQAASVITAVVWQNSTGVRGFRPMHPDDVIAQLDSVLDDRNIQGIKIGMLANPAIVRALTQRLQNLKIPIVLDPVMASGSGTHAMWQGSSNDLSPLLDICTVITPNLPEFEAIQPGSPLESHVQTLAKNHDINVLLKLGHAHDPTIQDIWATPDSLTQLPPLPRLPHDVRGTGCALSCALLAGIANGLPHLQAAQQARLYVHNRIKNCVFPGISRPSLGPVEPATLPTPLNLQHPQVPPQPKPDPESGPD